MELNNQEQQINKENFNRLVNEGALVFRNKKIKEIICKNYLTFEEKWFDKSMLKIWKAMFGDNL